MLRKSAKRREIYRKTNNEKIKGEVDLMNVKKEKHFNCDVWVSKEIDELRWSACLCMNCEKLGSCNISTELYNLCIKHNMSLACTKCPYWEKRKTNMLCV